MTKKGLSTIGDVIKPEVLESLGFKKRSPTTNLNEEKERRHYLFRGNNRRGIWNPKYDTLPKTRILSEKEKELVMTTQKGTVKLLVFNTMWSWDKVLDDMTHNKVQIEKGDPITSKNIKTYFQDVLHLPKEKVNSVGPRLAEIYERLGHTKPIFLIKENVTTGKAPSIYRFTKEAEALGYKGLFKMVFDRLPFQQRSSKIKKKKTQTEDKSLLSKISEAKAAKNKKVIHGHKSIATMFEDLRKAGVEEVTFKLRV